VPASSHVTEATLLAMFARLATIVLRVPQPRCRAQAGLTRTRRSFGQWRARPTASLAASERSALLGLMLRCYARQARSIRMSVGRHVCDAQRGRSKTSRATLLAMFARLATTVLRVRRPPCLARLVSSAIARTFIAWSSVCLRPLGSLPASVAPRPSGAQLGHLQVKWAVRRVNSALKAHLQMGWAPLHAHFVHPARGARPTDRSRARRARTTRNRERP